MLIKVIKEKIAILITKYKRFRIDIWGHKDFYLCKNPKQVIHSKITRKKMFKFLWFRDSTNPNMINKELDEIIIFVYYHKNEPYLQKDLSEYQLYSMYLVKHKKRQ